jgi:hypothetical protein
MDGKRQNRPRRSPGGGEILQGRCSRRITVAPGRVFYYASHDHKGSPCGSGTGDGGPVKALPSAFFFGLCGVSAVGLGGSLVGYGQQRSSKVDSLRHVLVGILSLLLMDRNVTETPPCLHRCFVPFFEPDLASLEGTFVPAVRIARSARCSAWR